jgi:hypothetical protein
LRRRPRPKLGCGAKERRKEKKSGKISSYKSGSIRDGVKCNADLLGKVCRGKRLLDKPQQIFRADVNCLKIEQRIK